MKTIWIFVVVAVLSLQVSAWAEEAPEKKPADADYISHMKCKVCHNKTDMGKIHDKWLKMDHAKAMKTLAGDEAKAVAKAKGLETLPAESPECLKCHQTAYNPKTKKVPATLEKTKMDGVQCESCHTPGKTHSKEALKKKKDPSFDLSINMPKPTANACVTCHNDESPTWDPEKYTLEDGTKVGFDFKQAWKKIKHGLPEKE